MASNDKWSDEKVAQLAKLIDEGKKPREIAEVMNCTKQEVYQKTKSLDRKHFGNTEYKQRLCLGGCKRYFASSGPGNRICPICSKRERNEVIAPVSISRCDVSSF